jgi:hypothetical protein
MNAIPWALDANLQPNTEGLMAGRTGTGDIHRAKRGVAVLAACIVQTLNETDPSFRERFLKHLSEAYYDLRDNWEGDVIQELELLSWTRELLTGLDHLNGQGEPFLQGH